MPDPDDTDPETDDETGYESFAADLEPLERHLLATAMDADDVGIGMLARLLETWAYTLATCRCDLTAAPPPGTLVTYLDGHDAYEPPEGRDHGAGPHGPADPDDDVRPDGGHRAETADTEALMDAVEDVARERDMDEVDLVVSLSEMVEVYLRIMHGRVPESVSDGDVLPDGGRRFNTQPVTCPECDGPLVDGECETDGCPGPDDVDGETNST